VKAQAADPEDLEEISVPDLEDLPSRYSPGSFPYLAELVPVEVKLSSCNFK